MMIPMCCGVNTGAPHIVETTSVNWDAFEYILDEYYGGDTGRLCREFYVHNANANKRIEELERENAELRAKLS